MEPAPPCLQAASIGPRSYNILLNERAAAALDTGEIELSDANVPPVSLAWRHKCGGPGAAPSYLCLHSLCATSTVQDEHSVAASDAGFIGCSKLGGKYCLAWGRPQPQLRFPSHRPHAGPRAAPQRAALLSPPLADFAWPTGGCWRGRWCGTAWQSTPSACASTSARSWPPLILVKAGPRSSRRRRTARAAARMRCCRLQVAVGAAAQQQQSRGAL